MHRSNILINNYTQFFGGNFPIFKQFPPSRIPAWIPDFHALFSATRFSQWKLYSFRQSMLRTTLSNLARVVAPNRIWVHFFKKKKIIWIKCYFSLYFTKYNQMLVYLIINDMVDTYCFPLVYLKSVCVDKTPIQCSFIYPGMNSIKTKNNHIYYR